MWVPQRRRGRIVVDPPKKTKKKVSAFLSFRTSCRYAFLFWYAGRSILCRKRLASFVSVRSQFCRSTMVVCKVSLLCRTSLRLCRMRFHPLPRVRREPAGQPSGPDGLPIIVKRTVPAVQAFDRFFSLSHLGSPFCHGMQEASRIVCFFALAWHL